MRKQYPKCEIDLGSLLGRYLEGCYGANRNKDVGGIIGTLINIPNGDGLIPI